MKLIEHPITFRLFLTVWNQAQRMTTPQVHLNMADWLQARWEAGDRRLLLMAFRSCGKSSVIGVFAAWLLYANPDLRILVLAAEGSLARKMVRNVRRIIEKHSFTAHLVPEGVDQWAGGTVHGGAATGVARSVDDGAGDGCEYHGGPRGCDYLRRCRGAEDGRHGGEAREVAGKTG